MRVPALAVVIATMCVTAAGCRDDVSVSRGVWSTSWSIWTADEPEIPGITTADVNVGEVDGKNVVVFWADHNGGSLNSGADPGSRGTLFTGQQTAVDGRTWSVSCTTVDGADGLVTIDGQEFDLRQGGLFLVSTSGKMLSVRQLKRNLPNRDPDLDSDFSDRLRDFARDTPEIFEFFRRTSESASSDSQTAEAAGDDEL